MTECAGSAKGWMNKVKSSNLNVKISIKVKGSIASPLSRGWKPANVLDAPCRYAR